MAAVVVRLRQCLLIASTLAGSWLGMQTLHELGHVLGAWATGAHVARVELDPRSFSRTDVEGGASPLLVLWFGPVFGAFFPLAIWAVWARFRLPGTYLVRFLAALCLVVNGVYIGAGTITRIADAGDLLRLGAPAWTLACFGILAVPVGLWLWHGQGTFFGLAAANGRVSARASYGMAAALLLWLGILTLGLPALEHARNRLW